MDMRVSSVVVWLVGLAVLPVFPIAVRAETSALAPYRAVYDLSVDDTGDSASSPVNGRMAMEFTGSRCSGYRSKMRIVTEGEDADGNVQLTDARTESLETATGRFQFTSQTYVNKKLTDQASGTAVRRANGITLSLTKPGKKSLRLDRAVVFPTEQMNKVLAAAVAGKHFVAIDLFDGTETGQIVFATAAVIGKESTAPDDFGAETLIGEAGFAGLPHWPVTISYFDKASGTDDAPSYVMSFVLYSNGISRSVRIDYSTFALVGHLSHLEMLPLLGCK
jgi:hypothetical protein